MAEAVHDGWYQLRGFDPQELTRRARRAAALYESGATWVEMREALQCSYTTLSALLHAGGITVGTRRPDKATIVHPAASPVSALDRWTRDVQRAPSPCMDAALAAHTAAIVRLHAELGLEAPELP